MVGETNPSWLSGGLAGSMVVYALFSAFVSGPELLHREAILKVDWPQQCTRIVHQELQDKQPQQETMPQIDLGGLFDGMFGRGTSRTYDDVINPMQKIIDLSNVHENALAHANEERLRKKAEAAGSRCACAVTMLTEHRVSLGLYAASGRLVTPGVFKDLDSSLQTSLRSSRCSQGG